MWETRWSPGLRQGDVVGQLAFPLIGNNPTVVAPGGLIGLASSAPQAVQVPVESRFAVVVSHDCEFNENKRNKLLLARIQAVPGNLTPEQIEDLRASNDVEERAEAGAPIAAVDSFLMEAIAGVFATAHVGIFTTITPLPMKMQGDLIDIKRAEMTQDSRILFRRKLAWFFGRHAEDIEPGQRVDPPGHGPIV